jgi:hypothetical protein
MKKAVFWDVAPCRNCVNRHSSKTHTKILVGKPELKKLLGSRDGYYFLELCRCSLLVETFGAVTNTYWKETDHNAGQ